MKLELREHHPRTGWSAPLPVALDAPGTLVLAFGASELFEQQGLWRELTNRFPRSCIAGCSTAGEIAGTKILDGSVSLAVGAFEHTRLRHASAPLLGPASSYDAGRAVTQALLAHGRAQAILVLSDGVSVNGSELIRGVNDVTRGEVVVTGGLAGDGPRFERTWVLEAGQARAARVTAVGFYGERLQVGFGCQGGWDIFGPERRVTRARANVLYELDGIPALALYKRYLGERASGLPATALLFPLAMRDPSLDEGRVVRTVLSVSEPEQSLTFAGDVPEGSLVQLMRANFDRLIDGAASAVHEAERGAKVSGPTLAVAISCIGRRLVLGERAEEEVEAVANGLAREAGLVGFYSYGEFSPRGQHSCALHNQTMTLTTFGEL